MDQLETNLGKWLFVLRNMSRLDRQSKRLQSEVFNRLFEEAKISRFTKNELREYENSLKAYRDLKNSLDSAEEKGRAEGLAEGKAAVASKLLAMGLAVDSIAEATGLTPDETSSL